MPKAVQHLTYLRMLQLMADQSRQELATLIVTTVRRGLPLRVLSKVSRGKKTVLSKVEEWFS
jgi:hypothetical protein